MRKMTTLVEWILKRKRDDVIEICALTDILYKPFRSKTIH